MNTDPIEERLRVLRLLSIAPRRHFESFQWKATTSIFFALLLCSYLPLIPSWLSWESLGTWIVSSSLECWLRVTLRMVSAMRSWRGVKTPSRIPVGSSDISLPIPDSSTMIPEHDAFAIGAGYWCWTWPFWVRWVRDSRGVMYSLVLSDSKLIQFLFMACNTFSHFLWW